MRRSVDGEDGGEDGLSRPAPAFPVFGGWELLEALLAGEAIDAVLSLDTVPEATAGFANF
jgi:hypothetical protein